MIIISDTTPIISLIKINRIECFIRKNELSRDLEINN